ncbi:hypothetical protein [Deinococcus sp.]
MSFTSPAELQAHLNHSGLQNEEQGKAPLAQGGEDDSHSVTVIAR